VATQEEWAKRSLAERLAHLASTADALGAALAEAGAGVLARPPAPAAWAPVEIVCHLRDNEEWFLQRLQQIMLMDEPIFVRTNPERWAGERQYLRNDAGPALAAFRARRDETLAFLAARAPGDLARAGVHSDSRGRRTLDDFVTVMAAHDDNHLDQLRRALAGRP